MDNLLTGSLVRLSAAEPEELVKAYMVWDRDSEFRRLLDDMPPRLWSKEKYEAWIKLSIEKKTTIRHISIICEHLKVNV